MATAKFDVLPITFDMADVDMITILQEEGIEFFSRYLIPISELMETTPIELHESNLDIKYFRSYLDIYYFEDVCIDTNQRWVEFAKAVSKSSDILNLIKIMKRKALFIDNIIPYMDYYDCLHLLVKREFMDIIRDVDLLTRIHRKGELKIITFFKHDSSRELALEWVNEYIAKNNCYRSFVTLTGDQVLNIGTKFMELNNLNNQLLNIYFKGINDERRRKFKYVFDDSANMNMNMTFLNRLFLIIHKLMAICILPMLKLVKNLERDLLAIEQHNELYNNESTNLENVIRTRFLKSIIETLKNVNYNKELVTKFYTQETIEWLYSGNPEQSDKLDDILSNTISYMREPFIKLYFDKEMYHVCRKIISPDDSPDSLTKSNYIRGEIISIFTAYLPYHEYYLNIWILNDCDFIEERLVELFIDFNDLQEDDAILYQNQTFELLKNFKNKQIIHRDKEVVHRFSHLLLENYKNYYNNYIAVIRYLHKYDFHIPLTQEESRTSTRVSPETSMMNAKWYQNQIYDMYEFINNTAVINHVLSPGTKEKFIVLVGNLMKKFTSEERNELKLSTFKDDEVFHPIQHLFNIYTMFCKFETDTGFRKGLVEETRFIEPQYIKKMVDVLIKKDKILSNEYDKIMDLHNYIIDEREKEMDDSSEIPEEFLDPIMGSVIEDPVCLPNTDIIMERDVILRHLLENQDNPFNRDPLTKKELDEFNSRHDIMAKIADFNARKKNYVE